MGEESSKWFKIAIEASRRYGGKIMVLPRYRLGAYRISQYGTRRALQLFLRR